MIIIGERINSTRASIAKAVQAKDVDFIQNEAVSQVKAGAHILDVNCGTVDAEEEPETLEWLVQTVQAAVDVPLCIDSPNPQALAAGLSVHKGKPLINSISGESKRYEAVLPLVKEYGAGVIALGVDDNGIPKGLDAALGVGRELVNRLLEAGLPVEDIYFDPLVQALAIDTTNVLTTLQVMSEMSAAYKGLHITSGLSNVSYGLPERRSLNRAFVVLGMEHGLDAIILDPTDVTLMALAYSTEALLNRDRHCMRYIRAYQQGKLRK